MHYDSGSCACLSFAFPCLLPQASIQKKVKILCTSPDPRNPQPSEADIAEADFVFHRALNLETNQFEPIQDALDDYQKYIDEQIPGKINGRAGRK